MKIVVLAAGKGTRMLPLTEHTPKPMLKYAGQTALDHLFSWLPEQIDEAVLVIKHLGEKIKAYCGDNFHGRKITYVQGEMKGTGHDFMLTQTCFRPGERFAIIYADEILSRQEIADCLQPEFSWLCFTGPEELCLRSGIAMLDERGFIKKVVEKPNPLPSRLIADGFMVANTDLFNYQAPAHDNGEIYLSELMGVFARDHEVAPVYGSVHPAMTVPEDLAKLDAIFGNR